MKWQHMASWVVGIAGLLLGLACVACGGDDDAQALLKRGANPLAAPKTATAPLWDLEPVSTALLDRVQEELGRRAGVRVVRVHAGSAASRAGVLDGDVLLAVEGVVVASPAEATTALAGRTGEIGITLLRIGKDDAWSLPQTTLTIAAQPPPPSPTPPPAPTVPHEPPALPAAAEEGTLGGVVDAYFDMLDFARTEGWGRPSKTTVATRRRSEALLRASLHEFDAPTRAAIEKIPRAWATLRARWAEAAETERRRQRSFWKTNLLLPNPLLPPTGSLATFRSEAGGHAFEHPADWVLAQTRQDDTGLLYLGPAGTQTNWTQAVDPAQSPPGVLFAIAPTDAGLEAVNSPEEGTRYVARRFVTGRAPGMKEVAAFRIGTGALVVYVGRWPGSTEESFCWVAAMPFGNAKFLAGRFSGPLAEAEALLPAFSVILATTDVTPPDDLASLQVNLAASIIGNAVINTGWSH